MARYYLNEDGLKTYNDLIKEKIAELVSFDVSVLDVLPAEGKEHILYLVPQSDASKNNAHDEYLWVNNDWELIGNTKINLDDYYTKEEIDSSISIIDSSISNIDSNISDIISSISFIITSIENIASSITNINTSISNIDSSIKNISINALNDSLIVNNSSVLFNSDTSYIYLSASDNNLSLNSSIITLADASNGSTGLAIAQDVYDELVNNEEVIASAQIQIANKVGLDSSLNLVWSEESGITSNNIKDAVENIDSNISNIDSSIYDLMALINSKQNNLTAGTNIKIEGDVISNTYEYDDTEVKTDIENIEKFIPAQATEQNKLADKDFVNSTVATNAANFRGNWVDWGSVPTAASDYPEDYVGSRTPTNNDYMVITDASAYSQTATFASDRTILSWNVEGVKGSMRIADIPGTRTNVGMYNELAFRKAGDIIYLYCNVYNHYKTSPSSTTYISGGGAYYTGYDIYTPFTNTLYTDPGLYSGSWRFIYVGTWLSNGKSGWLPQYKIGSSFTAAQQAAIDSNITAAKVAEIDEKQNILTAGNGITINNDVISAEMDIIDVAGDQTISPNRLYVFGSVDSAITITKGTDVQNKVNCYCVRFTIATGGTVTFSGFGTIKWNGSSNQPTFKVGKTYELNIENGYAFYGEF